MSKNSSKKRGKQKKGKPTKQNSSVAKASDSKSDSPASSSTGSSGKADKAVEPDKAEPTKARSAKAAELKPSKVAEPTPAAVAIIQAIDRVIGYFEQGFLVLTLFSLIGVGTYQFIAGYLFGHNSTWPSEVLKYLVFATAMGGAALSSQKGQMISMDFLERKFPPRGRVILRVFTNLFVIFACYLLVQQGLITAKASGDEGEILAQSKAYLVLPIGAALIAVHYTLHSICDVLYLAAGQIPPEEEGPQAH